MEKYYLGDEIPKDYMRVLRKHCQLIGISDGFSPISQKDIEEINDKERCKTGYKTNLVLNLFLKRGNKGLTKREAEIYICKGRPLQLHNCMTYLETRGYMFEKKKERSGNRYFLVGKRD